jgi:hypothetical protein
MLALGPELVKLIDFGLAQAAVADKANITTGFVGTPAFAARTMPVAKSTSVRTAFAGRDALGDGDRPRTVQGLPC